MIGRGVHQTLEEAAHRAASVTSLQIRPAPERPAAMRLVQLGVQQPQDDHVNTMMIAHRPNNRCNVRPPWRCNVHRRQAADRVAFGRHQHQLCGSRFYVCHRLSRTCGSGAALDQGQDRPSPSQSSSTASHRRTRARARQVLASP